MKNAIFSFLFCTVFVCNSFASQGLTYELYQGTGYIYQGEHWQSAITFNYISKPVWSDRKDRVYGKILFAREIAKFYQTPVTVGAFVSQLRETDNSDYINTTIGFPLGLRFPVQENVQLDVYINTINVVSQKAYDSFTSAYYGDSESSGRSYLSSGFVNLSLFF